MQVTKLGIFVLTTSLALGTAGAQDAKQDAQKAGSETKSAAKDTASSVSKGTKKA